MKIIKSFILLLTGTAFGVGFVLSCGDDSPRHIDAATCDCPAGEPPLAGRLITNESQSVTIATGITSGVGAGCAAGQQVLSGGCFPADRDNLHNVTLVESAPDKPQQPGWRCVFKNNEAVDVQVKATVLCLKPPTQ